MVIHPAEAVWSGRGTEESKKKKKKIERGKRTAVWVGERPPFFVTLT